MTKKINVNVEQGDKINEAPENFDPTKDELTEEQKEYARITVRKEFNENFSKWAEIDPENATDEDIEQVKKDFDDCVEENKAKMYHIASHDDGIALLTAKFLKEWNEKFNTWEKGSWRGLIHFDKVISEKIKELEADPELDFDIDYSTLIFLYSSMNEPKGTGLESARVMAKFENYNEETGKVFEEDIPVTYSGVLEKIKIHVQNLSNIDKKLTILKERVNLAYAGLKMNLKITEIEEFLEFYVAITAHAVNNDSDVQNETSK